MKYIRTTPDASTIKRGNNKIVLDINGSDIPTLRDFYTVLAEGLEFPDYFGDNLDALYDMLLDLQWLKQDAIELVITNFNDFLNAENEETITEVLILLEDVIAEWKDGEFEDDEWEIKKFRVYFICDDQVRAEISKLLDEAE